MTRLEWGAAGERYYEAGVDRGVLYVDGVGVPWNGLVSVAEAPSGGDATPYYIDGVKYLNRAAPEEFGATITAFTYPDEFSACDGSEQIGWGLYATQQRRRPFSFAYRTKVGNDLDGVDAGYKIHLVYNALAAPSQRANATFADTTTPGNFSWTLTTTPPAISQRQRTSHLVVDSRTASDTMIARVESILYGTDAAPPRMPSVAELIELFELDASGFYDAGGPGSTFYTILDGGHIPESQTTTVDGGTP